MLCPTSSRELLSPCISAGSWEDGLQSSTGQGETLSELLPQRDAWCAARRLQKGDRNDYNPQMGALHPHVSSTTSPTACCNRPSAATAEPICSPGRRPSTRHNMITPPELPQLPSARSGGARRRAPPQSASDGRLTGRRSPSGAACPSSAAACALTENNFRHNKSAASMHPQEPPPVTLQAAGTQPWKCN